MEKLCSCCISYTKNNSRWIIDLNVKIVRVIKATYWEKIFVIYLTKDECTIATTNKSNNSGLYKVKVHFSHKKISLGIGIKKLI